MLNPSDHSPEQPANSHPLKQLIQKHQFVFWGGLWITLLSVGGFAAVGLLTPGSTQQNTPKPTPAPPTVQVSAPREDLPLSLFTAIALGCAAGSFLFVYVLVVRICLVHLFLSIFFLRLVIFKIFLF